MTNEDGERAKKILAARREALAEYRKEMEAMGLKAVKQPLGYGRAAIRFLPKGYELSPGEELC